MPRRYAKRNFRYAKKKRYKKRPKMTMSKRMPLDLHRFRLVLLADLVVSGTGYIQAVVRPWCLEQHYQPSPQSTNLPLFEVTSFKLLFDSYRPLGTTITYTPEQTMFNKDNNIGPNAIDSEVALYCMIDYDNTNAVDGTNLITRTQVKKRSIGKHWKLKYRVGEQYQNTSAVYRPGGFMNLQTNFNATRGIINISSADQVIEASVSPAQPLKSGTPVGEVLIESYYLFKGRN